MNDEAKKYLSPTQINMYLRCPKSYEYRYLEGLKIPPTGAMKQSSCWHETLAQNYTQKIKTHEDLEINNMQEIFSDVFDETFDDEEIIIEEDETRHTLKDQGIKITKEHHKVIAPYVQPVMVEKSLLVEMPEIDFDLMGIIDCVDDNAIIIDNKAYGKTPNQNDVDKDLQLGIYSLLYRKSFNDTENGLRIDAVIKTKTPKAVQISTKRSDEDCDWTENLIYKVNVAIKNNVFFPNPNGWHCSPNWCGYWNLCKKTKTICVL